MELLMSEQPRDGHQPFLSLRSSSINDTREDGDVPFFVVQGLANLSDGQMIFFTILLLVYTTILGGNTLIIFVVKRTFPQHPVLGLMDASSYVSLCLLLQTLTDPKLSSPMYFFLYNLSFVDMLFTTSIMPNMLAGFLMDQSTISFPGCFLQMYFFIQLSVTGRAILTVMAYDRYVAICNPLRYTAIMTRPVQVLLVVGAWGFGVLCTVPATAMALRRSYCGPNVIQHGWCDPSSVRRLVCGDTSADNVVSLAFALVALLTTGLLILTSHVLIFVAMSRMGFAQRLKALGTCAAHLTVVSFSYSAASFIYISYRVGNVSPEVRIIVSVLYSALTPFLNPIVYSLRNKELRDAIRRIGTRFRPAVMSGPKDIRTVT